MEATPFTIENIPYGVISTKANVQRRCATAFEENAVDLSILEKHGLFHLIAGFEKRIFALVYWFSTMFYICLVPDGSSGAFERLRKSSSSVTIPGAREDHWFLVGGQSSRGDAPCPDTTKSSDESLPDADIKLLRLLLLS